MKRILLIVVGVIPTLLFGQEEFSVKGKVGGLGKSAKIYMQYEDGEDRLIDSAKITDGKFSFHGVVKEPTQAFILLSRDGTPINELIQPEVNIVYLSKGVIKFEGDDFEKVRATGTSLNDEFARYRLGSEKIQEQIAALDNEFQHASEEQQNDPAFIGELQKKASAIFAQQNTINEQFIRENPESFITLNLIEDLLSPATVKDFSHSFDAMPTVYKQTIRGQRIQQRINKLIKLAVGEVAPDFNMPDTSGQPLALSSFRGQYVLIDFWASWCGPCRQENPNVVAAYSQFKDKGFTILGVSLDTKNGKEAWLSAIKEDGLEQWSHVSDLNGWESKVVDLYAIRGIPQNFLLDKEGRIIASNLRGEALLSKLSEIIK